MYVETSFLLYSSVVSLHDEIQLLFELVFGYGAAEENVVIHLILPSLVCGHSSS